MSYRLRKMIQLDMLNLFINPTWMCFSILFPFLLITIIGFMTKGMYGETVTSYDYYGVTLMVYSGLYTGTFSANSFMEERIKKANLRSIYSPIHQWEIPLLKTLATFFYTTFFYTFVAVITGGLFSINYGDSLVKLWLLFAAINFASSSLGVLMCCIFKSEGVANQILSIMTNIVALTAGLLFPTAFFGQSFGRFCEKLPLSQVMKSIFELIYDHNSHNYYFSFVGSILTACLFLLLAIYFFKGEDYV